MIIPVPTSSRGFCKNLVSALFCIAAAGAISTAALAQQPGGVTVFEGARLIPGDGGAPVEDAVFTVQDGRISAIGRRGSSRVPAGARRVDLGGKTVMPAIIDTHKHLAGEQAALEAQLRQLAYYGIGAVMSLGQDTSDVTFAVRDAAIPGAARLFSAGRGITMPEPGRSEAPIWINNADEGRQAVRGQAARGVDFIKIWVDDRGGQYRKMPPDVYAAIIDEAHRHGIPVAAHIHAMEDAKGLLRAGIDVFAHGVRDADVDEETVELFRQHPDVFLVPNLPDRGVVEDFGWLAGSLSADEVAKLQAASRNDPEARAFFGIQARNMLKLHRAGVKVAFGTDGGVLWEPHLELERMVAAGMTPAEVIRAATATSAELLGMDDTGTLAPGMRADFIVLDANPLEDITHTRRIAAVYLDGREIDRGPHRH